MSTPDEILAAGIMAKLTGSVLKKIDESTTTPSNTSGPAMRIDPLAVIRNQTIDPQKQQMLRQINAAAEAAYPLPPPTTPLAPVTQTPSEPSSQQEFNFGPTQSIAASSDVSDTLKSIDKSIKKLVNLLESKWQTN